MVSNDSFSTPPISARLSHRVVQDALTLAGGRVGVGSVFGIELDRQFSCSGPTAATGCGDGFSRSPGYGIGLGQTVV